MSKNFLILIALSLYVDNSNCAAAAGTSKEQYENRARMSSFEITESPHLVAKILNILLDELRARRDIETHHQKSILAEYRKMVLKKAEALDKSKANFKKYLELIAGMLTPDCLSHNMVICFCSKVISWLQDRQMVQLVMMTDSIASQQYDETRRCKVHLEDLVWKVLTAEQVRNL